VNSEAPDVVIGENLALAGVQTGANLDPSGRTPSRMAIALLIARLGPSNVASIPSPSDVMKCPR